MRLLFVLLLLAAPALATPDVKGIAFQPRPGTALPMDARFVDEDGRQMRLGDMLGRRPAILAAGYYQCPNLCGVVRADLFSALAASGLNAGSDYDVLLFSIDGSETPVQAAQAKAADLARFPAPGAQAGWHFLTGPIAAVAEAVGYHASWDDRLHQFIHPAGVVVITPAGVVSSYLLGVGYTSSGLQQAIRLAGSGAVAAPPAPVLLLCFHYDAVTGRYTFAIERVVQAAALLTVAGIVGLLAMLHGRRA